MNERFSQQIHKRKKIRIENDNIILAFIHSLKHCCSGDKRASLILLGE